MMGQASMKRRSRLRAEFDQKAIVVTRSLYKVRVDKFALSQAQIYRAGPWGQGGAIVE